MLKRTKVVKICFLSVLCLSWGANAQKLDYSVFGNVHVSLDNKKSADNADLNSNTSTFGIKGGRKLNDNIKAIFKLEWQLDVTNRKETDAVVDRDQWIGFKGSFGKLLIGTSTSNYKQTSSKIDPLWRTQLEGRSVLMATSSRRLSAGAGNDRGRLTDSINYTTPSFNNFSIVVNTTFSGNDSETSGIGIRHATKKSLVFIDYFSDGGVGDVSGDRESAIKIGGYYVLGSWKVSGQIESSKDIDGSDYMMLGASYKIDDTGTVKFTIGEADGKKKSSSFALLYDYKLGDKSNVYVGYGSRKDDINADDNIVTIGARYIY